MRQFKRGNLLFLLLPILFLGACQFSERPESSFSDYKEVTASDLLEKGWIPDWLPQTAVNIHEKHDLDSNASILFFEAGSGFSAPPGCEPASNPPTAPFQESWWPRSVEPAWLLYDCGNQHYLAVDEAKMSVYFWRP